MKKLWILILLLIPKEGEAGMPIPQESCFIWGEVLSVSPYYDKQEKASCLVGYHKYEECGEKRHYGYDLNVRVDNFYEKTTNIFGKGLYSGISCQEQNKRGEIKKISIKTEESNILKEGVKISWTSNDWTEDEYKFYGSEILSIYYLLLKHSAKIITLLFVLSLFLYVWMIFKKRKKL